MARRFFTTLTRIGAALHESRRRARTRTELSSLSDRQLADIGISRSEISSVALYGRRH
jgi:uncharacterized protein YjiS (DUF1127 family)